MKLVALNFFVWPIFFIKNLKTALAFYLIRH